MWQALSLLAAGELGGALKRNTVIAAVYVVAVAVLLAALGFVVGACHELLARAYGSVAASLIIAGALALVSLALVVVALVLRHRSRRRHSMATAALMVAPAVAPSAIRAIVAHPTIGAGVVAGVVAIAALVGRNLYRGNES